MIILTPPPPKVHTPLWVHKATEIKYSYSHPIEICIVHTDLESCAQHPLALCNILCIQGAGHKDYKSANREAEAGGGWFWYRLVVPQTINNLSLWSKGNLPLLNHSMADISPVSKVNTCSTCTNSTHRWEHLLNYKLFCLIN